MPFIILLAVFVWVVVLLLKFNYAKLRGVVGEWRTKDALANLDQEAFRVINDFLFELDGKTVQIDHLVISRSGIFVIETKAYNGWLFGNDRGQPWKQVLYRYKGAIGNPLNQNYGHVKSLERRLEQAGRRTAVIGVVALAGGHLKNGPIPGVVYARDLYEFIIGHATASSEETDIDGIHEFLLDIRLEGKEHARQHIKMVREISARHEEDVALGICPRCGGRLVRRKGRYGAFTGCSQYPKCRFVSR